MAKKDDKTRDLFGADLGRKLRDLRIDQVEAGADPDWRDAAIVAIHDCARARIELTVDDVWPLIPAEYETPDGRAMGAVMQRARGLDWITPLGRFVPSENPNCHAAARLALGDLPAPLK